MCYGHSPGSEGMFDIRLKACHIKICLIGRGGYNADAIIHRNKNIVSRNSMLATYQRVLPMDIDPGISNGAY
jgi:hypothetical protein